MRASILILVLPLVACAPPAPAKPPPTTGPAVHPVEPATGVEKRSLACSDGKPLKVTFYDAGQALAALVDLPDGRRVLVDAGEHPKRPGCSPCKEWHRRVMDGLKRDLGPTPIDMLWITHQHSDHLGGAADVLSAFNVRAYVDNGFDLEKPTVAATRKAADDRTVKVTVIGPDAHAIPIADTETVKLTPVVPKNWPSSCGSNPNDCSIGLRIDYCQTSVLFTGDAEEVEEAALAVAPVTLLQVGHHGSDTSTSDALVAASKPAYAVVSSGKIDEGTNKGYCHPRLSTVARLTKALGGPGSKRIAAFDAAVKCKDSEPSNWRETATSDRMWFTARDGEVVLVSRGDGTFTRQATQ